jgi:hypothetical protein
MDQHDGSHGSGQVPGKDFLALTHGQEWVSFYESFDKLVQDHLSRSSELLRRAMSLPEVADREVAQVRAEMEGKLAAERERSHDLLTKLRDEISASHEQVASLAQGVQGVAADLASLNARVSDALASLDLPATGLTARADAPAIEATAEPMPALNGVVGDVESVPEGWAASDTSEESAADAAADVAAPIEAVADAPVEEAVFESESEPESKPEPEPAPAAEEWLSEPVAEFGEAEARFDAETGLDLSALAEAETSIEDDLPVSPMSDEAGTGALDGEAVGVGADRPRPHWLSVTRIGARP